MQMPKLMPLPIKTKGKHFFARIWVWITRIRTWEVVEDWAYTLSNGTQIVIPKGFVFDGASIPRPLWAILSPTGLLLVPGLIHDFGYRYDYMWTSDTKGNVYKIHEGAGQAFWDQIFFREGERVNGMKMINWLAWLALSTMGWMAWSANRKRIAADLQPTGSISDQPVREPAGNTVRAASNKPVDDLQ